MRKFIPQTVLCAGLLVAVRIAASAELPGLQLDLTSWKLTLPIDSKHHGQPDEIQPRQLGSFIDPAYFFVHPTGEGVVFRAPCGGVPSKGSSYPRCELREMAPDQKTLASWSTADEKTHRMQLTAAITHTPAAKPHVVCAQIHDASDDLLELRLEGKKLFIERRGEVRVMLDANYVLGTRFDLKIQAGDGRVEAWHNGHHKLDWRISCRGCYFKAGCYTQSNVAKGDAPEAYGEVVIYRLALNEPEVENPVLRDELLRRARQDQAVRNELIAQGIDKANDEIYARMKQIDGDNQVRMKAIVQEHGWPTGELVGKDAVHEAFLLVQHASDTAFQKEMLPLIEKSYKSGDLEGPSYALLMDRVRVREGKPQLYGTQARSIEEWKDKEPSLLPIEDEANVEKRRAEVGLPPRAVYLKMLKDVYFPAPAPP